ncbi:MAG: BMC domain-containing protein [Firmicutes bacterium]|nr:BMC domain-containing protein [Bacillota bacterium]
MQGALGLIEVIGLAAAYEVADVAVKTANVRLLELERSGRGMMTVKITGEVGAVTAAVDAAVAAGNRISEVYASKIIARPDREVVEWFSLSQDV